MRDWMIVAAVILAILETSCSGGLERPVENEKTAATSDRKNTAPSAESEQAAEPWQQRSAAEVIVAGDRTHGPPKELAVDLGGGLKMEFLLIPAGDFMMGDESSEDERPIHKVQITKPFYLGRDEVTQEQWQAVMGSNPSRFKGAKNPVESVSWEDCLKFLKKLNAMFVVRGGEYGLPTESQWEYACRAGTTSKWSFGDDAKSLGDYAWCAKNSGGATHPVGQKKPNAWGLHDMQGNVWEWCADWYVSDYSQKSPAEDPAGLRAPRSARGLVVRWRPRLLPLCGPLWLLPGRPLQQLWVSRCQDFEQSGW